MQGDLEAFVREKRMPVSQVNLTRWMQSLFEEKLAQQKEALQDIKQLTDIIAAQQVELACILGRQPWLPEDIVGAGGLFYRVGLEVPNAAAATRVWAAELDQNELDPEAGTVEQVASVLAGRFALSPGQITRAPVSFTSTASGEERSSRASKPRPARTGIPIVSK